MGLLQNATSRLLLTETLTSWGLEVRAFATLQEASKSHDPLFAQGYSSLSLLPQVAVPAVVVALSHAF